MSANPVRPNCARRHSCSLDVRLDAMARSPLTRELKPEEHLDLDSFVTSWAWSEGDPLMMAEGIGFLSRCGRSGTGRARYHRWP